MKKGKKYARARSVSTRSGRPPIAGACAALSDWEVDEARLDRERCGTPIAALAGRYGVSAKTLERAFKRMDEKRGGDRMTATDELKPCPFCGGNWICVDVGIYIGKVHESVTIKCDDCGASIWGATEEKAIAAWNRRVKQ